MLCPEGAIICNLKNSVNVIWHLCERWQLSDYLIGS